VRAGGLGLRARSEEEETGQREGETERSGLGIGDRHRGPRFECTATPPAPSAPAQDVNTNAARGARPIAGDRPVVGGGFRAPAMVGDSTHELPVRSLPVNMARPVFVR